MKENIDVLPFPRRRCPRPRKFDELDKEPLMQLWRDELQRMRGVVFFGLNPASVNIAPALTRWVEEQRATGKGNEGGGAGISAGVRGVAGGNIGTAVTGNGNLVANIINIFGASTDPVVASEAVKIMTRELEVRYLRHLQKTCNALPLAAFGSDSCADEDVTLDRVYIDLNTTTTIPVEDAKNDDRRGYTWVERKTRVLTVMEAAAHANRLRPLNLTQPFLEIRNSKPLCFRTGCLSGGSGAARSNPRKSQANSLFT